MGTPAITMTVDGQDFRVTTRPGDPGVCDFDWLNHPVGYGFTSVGPPMSRAEMEDTIRSFLADINPPPASWTEAAATGRDLLRKEDQSHTPLSSCGAVGAAGAREVGGAAPPVGAI